MVDSADFFILFQYLSRSRHSYSLKSHLVGHLQMLGFLLHGREVVSHNFLPPLLDLCGQLSDLFFAARHFGFGGYRALLLNDVRRLEGDSDRARVITNLLVSFKILGYPESLD